MYQFYYADTKKKSNRCKYKDNINNYINITKIRPQMWEEHCLECAAPLCYGNCANYLARSDGRCKRLYNSFLIFGNKKACCHKGCHIKFRK